jgi:hypothetical protein
MFLFCRTFLLTLLYRIRYIESPFSETPKKNVPQHLSPVELKQWLKDNPEKKN